jgi:hypothetical protein
MKLDHSNYHSLKNRYLTNSRINDWNKCHRFFQDRHITGKRSGIVMTDALRIGKAVDTLIFFGKDEFLKNFIAVSRRSFKKPPENIIELTEKQFDDVLGMGEVLKRQPAMIECANHETQKIITLDMPIGEHFIGLSAIPDAIQIKDGVCTLSDLKTAWEADDHKYHWKCMTLGYYRQFAVMTIILRKINPEIKSFVYRHIGCEKDRDGIFNPFAFYLANERVEYFVDDVLENIIPAIAAEKDFKPKEVSWDKAITIGSMEEEF